MECLPEKELKLADVLTVCRRRRVLMLGTIALSLMVVAIYCSVITPLYESVGIVEIQKQGAGMAGLSDLISSGSDAPSDLGTHLEIQTQADILQSDTVALRTIEALHLEDTADFKSGVAEWISDRLHPGVRQDPPGAPLRSAPKRRQQVLKVFAKRLKVKPNAGTRLIEVHYLNPDPQVSAAVVNTLTKSLIDHNFQTRYEATNQASTWLNNQLGELRKQTEDLQARVADLQKQTGIYNLGVTDAQGRAQAYSAVLDQLQQSSRALNTAKQNRILKGAIQKAAEAGDAEMLSGLAGNTLMTTNNTLEVIHALRQQEATQQSALQQALAKYGSDYPKLAELRAGLAGTQRSIEDEVIRIRGRAQSDFDIAVQFEQQTRKQYDENRTEADLLNNKSVEYAVLLQEAESSRGLYQDLLKHLKEAGVLAGLQLSNITIVDPAQPTSIPARPNVPLYTCIALFGGLLFGSCAAFTAESLDSKIHTVADLEELLGQNIVGAIPDFSRKRKLYGNTSLKLTWNTARALTEPNSSYTEAMRSVRTSVLMARNSRPPQAVLVTSALEGEGKTTFSANLGTVLALHGKSVLIVDTDMRKSTLAKHFGFTSTEGLSDLLAGKSEEPSFHTVERLPNLKVLLAGRMVSNPSELLGSEAMRHWLEKWREEFDMVVLDGTPVLPVTDSVVLDALCDMTLLLVKSKTTERQLVTQAYKMLAKDRQQHNVGAVLNCLSPEDRGYYGYYGYYGYKKAAYREEGRGRA